MTEPDSPLLRAKVYNEPSLFTAENLLREGRRQRSLPAIDVPQVCLLDPDGDVVRHLRARDLAMRHEGWACYHSELWTTHRDYGTLGTVPCAVGASYAVLVAEELHASGCRLIVSVTSAGRIRESATPPYFVLIEKAWRDEGTSLHYLPPAEWSYLDPKLAHRLRGAFMNLDEPVIIGSSWTTDAPLRETATAIAAARELSIDAVEMEASALYAYSTVRQQPIVCIAHVTNTMATEGDDFEKGENEGTDRTLAVTDSFATHLLDHDDRRSSSSEP
jgi:uridine phosphorylase